MARTGLVISVGPQRAPGSRWVLVRRALGVGASLAELARAVDLAPEEVAARLRS